MSLATCMHLPPLYYAMKIMQWRASRPPPPPQKKTCRLVGQDKCHLLFLPVFLVQDVKITAYKVWWRAFLILKNSCSMMQALPPHPQILHCSQCACLSLLSPSSLPPSPPFLPPSFPSPLNIRSPGE